MTRLRSLSVGELMTTALVTVHSDATLAHAMDTMRVADIRHLLVVDAKERLVGILSDRDLLHLPGKDRHGVVHRVREVMSTNVASVGPDTMAREAAALLLDRKIGALAVLDDNLALVGIVTETDFLRVVLEAFGGGSISEASRE